MKNNPLVTVITIVFNGQETLSKAIESVANQTYPNVEYIIIDGGSTDRTLDIIKKYDDVINYWISEKDKGISDAFNKAIKLVKGDIVGILNADDWYERNAIASVVEIFENNKNTGIVYGWMNYWKGKVLTNVYQSNHRLLDYRMSVSHTALFVAKEVYGKYGVFDESYKYAMDYELVLRFFKNGVVFVPLNQVVSNMSSGGASYVNWVDSSMEVARAKSKYQGILLPYGYFAYRVIRKCASNLFYIVGLGWIVKWYKDKFCSGIRKL